MFFPMEPFYIYSFLPALLEVEFYQGRGVSKANASLSTGNRKRVRSLIGSVKPDFPEAVDVFLI